MVKVKEGDRMTFEKIKEVIRENTANDFRRNLVPAIRHPSGKIYIGKRGLEHIDIRYKHSDEEGPLKGDAGFIDIRNHRKDGKFYPKYGKDGLNIDSTDLIPRTGLMRRYQTEETNDLEDYDLQPCPPEEHARILREAYQNAK
jgi:hypothetical protein